tara:strand:- start:178 stop:459 length:282 start_codon:yes stop_codon:yes gene_type:complete
MKITKRQLRRIIKEEKTRLLKETAPLRFRGAFVNDAEAEKIKRSLTLLYNATVNNIIAEEGVMTEEAEELGAQTVVEIFKEFLDSVGFRHFIK